MNKEQAIEHLKLIRLNAGMTGAESFKEALDLAIVSLSQPSLPSGLDEAAKQFQERWDNDQSPEASFKAGAQWRDAQIPKLPDSIDEAAEEYAYNNWEDNDYHTGASEGLPFDAIGHTERCFKAGAEWMAGQYKTLGETEIYLEDDGGEAPYTQEWLDLATTEFAVPEGFKPGDKVFVQIRKIQ